MFIQALHELKIKYFKLYFAILKFKHTIKQKRTKNHDRHRKLKPEIVKRLMPLKPDKIILFGSYAYGTRNEDSDIDLFLLKDNLTFNNTRYYSREARGKIRDLIYGYKIGFDILSVPTDYFKQREDYFYQVDILQNGKVLYE
ncbi:MAG: nucleotidyltransferase domain-containing protein [Verrucomicrobiota bacterium]|nr:nucleotidyltransferase domain-containing protein [Verrucomicrobiota bacterium]